MFKTRMVIVFIFIVTFLIANNLYAYTEKEYEIYQEMMNTPMSVSEEEALKRIGDKYGMSPAEVEATIEKVMEELYSGGRSKNKGKKQLIEDSVNKLDNVTVKDVTVSSDYAGVLYTYDKATWNDEEVINKVKSGMPEILEVIFDVQGIERVTVKAFYPAHGGGDKKVAVLECSKSVFNENKTIEDCELTVY